MGLLKITHLISGKMSACGGKAEVFQGVAKSPLIAKSGHLSEDCGERTIPMVASFLYIHHGF